MILNLITIHFEVTAPNNTKWALAALGGMVFQGEGAGAFTASVETDMPIFVLSNEPGNTIIKHNCNSLRLVSPAFTLDEFMALPKETRGARLSQDLLSTKRVDGIERVSIANVNKA